MLYGRDTEQALINRLLTQVRDGRSGALCLLGEPGVGKSALLDHAIGQSNGMLVLRGGGVEVESELAFATLHQLLLPVLDRLGRLPAPQARALEAALGLATASDGNDRFLIGAGVLTLLGDVAEDRPVLCVVDDLHWADQPSTAALAFAARRLEAEGVLVLAAAREEPLRPPATDAMTVLRVGGLDQTAAGALLAERAGPRLAPEVRDQLVAATGGNPLALIELPALLTGEQLDGTAPLPDPLPVGDNTGRAFTAQLERLDPAARTLLLLAAADGADPGVLLRAADRAGIDPLALEAAEAANLLAAESGTVAFRHPLIRAAVYRHATTAERRAAHRTLAAVLDGEGMEDRRAWHLAAAAPEPDERVAAALERSAGRAAQRGGHAAAATALERAAGLTPDEEQRSRRLVAAADAAWLAGQMDRARALLDRASPPGDATATHARLDYVRGRLEVTSGATDIGYRLLLEGAERIAARQPDLAASMLLEATHEPWLASDFGRVSEIVEHLARLPGERSRQEAGLMRFAAGAELVLTGDIGGALAIMRESLGLLAAAPPSHSLDGRPLIMAGVGALVLADDTAALELATRTVTWARTRGLIGWLPQALMVLAAAETLTGRYAAALADACEGLRLAEETGQRFALLQNQSMLAFIAAVQGDEQRCHDYAGRVLGPGREPRMGPATAGAIWALALLDLGLGRPEQALERLLEPAGHHGAGSGHHVVWLHAAGDLVEAAVRAGQPQLGQLAFTGNRTVPGFERWAAATAQPWTGAVAARCRALLAWTGDPEDSEPHFVEALRLHQHATRPFELARTELVYGEWLRRVRRRRSAARVHLRAALELFDRLGATPWSDQARRELRASGEPTRLHPHPQLPAMRQLTPQELQVARLAARGGSNREIAAQLFLSPRTVGYHLHKVFTKLGISSRVELARLEIEPPGEADRR